MTSWPFGIDVSIYQEHDSSILGQFGTSLGILDIVLATHISALSTYITYDNCFVALIFPFTPVSLASYMAYLMRNL